MTDEPQEVWPDEERRAYRSEMMEVVVSVTSTLNEVVIALRAEIVALGENERRGRNRITMFLAVVTIAATAAVAGAAMNYSQGQDVKSIVHYIQDCQKPDSECKRRNDQQVGNAVVGISGSVFDASACLQKVPLEQRTDERIKTCRDQYIGAPTK